LDTALLYPVDCISDTRLAFSNDAKQKRRKIRVVGICYEGIHESWNKMERENVKHLCEDESDDFDIPVLSNNITYKNIFCFLCNTNYSIANGALFTEPYIIADLKFICDEQFLFNFLIDFQQIFAQALIKKCDVKLEADFLAVCDDDDTPKTSGTISKCKALGSHFDHIEKWACENTSHQSFTPVGNFKNEFCLLCNPSEKAKLPANVQDCKETDKQNAMYNNACLSLPNVEYHPRVHPYKNIFCLYCAEKNNETSNYSVDKCIPNFMRKSPHESNLMRHLFTPLVTFKPSAFQLESEVSLYGITKLNDILLLNGKVLS
jgi:hypothetical protein